MCMKFAALRMSHPQPSRLMVIIYGGWIGFLSAFNEAHVKYWHKRLGNLSEFNHILINNCANLIKTDNVQMASSVVNLLGNSFVFSNIHLNNLWPVQIKVLINCVVCCPQVKVLSLCQLSWNWYAWNFSSKAACFISSGRLSCSRPNNNIGPSAVVALKIFLSPYLR